MICKNVSVAWWQGIQIGTLLSLSLRLCFLKTLSVYFVFVAFSLKAGSDLKLPRAVYALQGTRWLLTSQLVAGNDITVLQGRQKHMLSTLLTGCNTILLLAFTIASYFIVSVQYLGSLRAVCVLDTTVWSFYSLCSWL